MRIACVNVPHFPLAAWYRVDPELRGLPVVVTEGVGSRAKVIDLSPEAQPRGAVLGASVVQNRVICSDLVVRSASNDVQRAAQAALCDVADACSPRVEDAGRGTVFLDLEGLGGLYGSEKEIAHALMTSAARVALEASVGIASTKIVALLAAQQRAGASIVPREEEWRFLAPLPIFMLDPSPALRETLVRWGIRRVGDLAALPASSVASRLGAEAARLARRARGEDEYPLTVRKAPLRFEEMIEIDYAIDSLEPFLFVLRPLLDRLTARLALRGFICGDLRLSLGLANRGHDERTVVVAAPSNDAKSLLTLLRLQLEAHPPTAPVEKISIAAVAERLRAVQLDLFRPNGPAPEQLAVTLARLAALCGADRLGSPAVADSHRPDAYGLVPFGQPSAKTEDRGQRTEVRGQRSEVRRNVERGTLNVEPPVIALRAIRPRQPLEVFYNRDQLDFVRPASSECGVRRGGGRKET
jgi:protein ImuB